MRIALTGATGFLGRYILGHLTGRGDQVRAWYRTKEGGASAPPPRPGLQWVVGDLRDQEAPTKLVAGCDAVVHAALDRPSGRFIGAEGDIVGFVEANVVGSLRLIEEARRAGVGRFVFISTCAVHDVIRDDRPLDEAHPTWARSHYGAHKAAIEAFVHSYGLGQGYPICALRPTGIYGRAELPERSKWFELVDRVLRGENVRCTRGGKEVHAADVARAVALLLDAQVSLIAGQSFNCCDRYISDHEVATIARRISDATGQIEGQPAMPRHHIETGKLRALGMTFGGTALLEATIAELVGARRAMT